MRSCREISRGRERLPSGYTCIRKQQGVVGADLGTETFGTGPLYALWGIYLG